MARATYVRDGSGKRVRDVLIGLFIAGLGFGAITSETNPEPGVGLALMAVGLLGVLITLFNPWRRV